MNTACGVYVLIQMLERSYFSKYRPKHRDIAEYRFEFVIPYIESKILILPNTSGKLTCQGDLRKLLNLCLAFVCHAVANSQLNYIV